MTEDKKKYTILKPEPFIIGGPTTQNKYPGGYIGKIILTDTNEVVYECIESSPTFATNACVYWCLMGDRAEPLVDNKVEMKIDEIVTASAEQKEQINA